MSRLRSAWASVRGFFDLRDAHYYGGLVLVAAGCYWLEPAAGIIAMGAGLIYAAVR